MRPTMRFGESILAARFRARVRRWAAASRWNWSRLPCLSHLQSPLSDWRLRLVFFGHGDGLRKPYLELVAHRLCGGFEFGGRRYALRSNVVDEHPLPHARVPSVTVLVDIGNDD